MHFPGIVALFLGFTPPALGQGQSLSLALQNYPDFSSFRQVLDKYPSLFSSIIPHTTQRVTVLIPTNEALDQYATKNGQLTSMPLSSLTNVMSYHVMVAPLTSTNFTHPHGLTVPTMLEDPQYNNRTPGSDLTRLYGASATGQVLFVQQVPSAPTQGSNSINVRGGLGQLVNLTAVDGQWALGYFQAINAILTPPMPCSDTIGNQSSLKDFDETLDKVPGVYDTIDHTPNVTCLAPSNDAYDVAGSTQDSLNSTALITQILYHTIPEVTYSNFLYDGMTLTSLANMTVKITLKGNDIYFNDAKVVTPNVITNNGLIHVLDKIMTPLNETSASGTGSPTNSATTSSTSKPNTGITGSGSGDSKHLLALLVAAVALFL